MLSAVMNFRVKPGQLDEFINRWNQSLREIEHTPGLGPIYLLTDAQGNRCVSVAVWQDAEAGQNWDKTPQFRKFRALIKDCLASDPVRELYQVTAGSSQVYPAGPSADSLIRSA